MHLMISRNMLRKTVAALQFHQQGIGIVEGNPAVTLTRIGLQKPPLGRTLAIRFLHNGEHTDTSELAGLAIVRTRAGADVEIILAFALRGHTEGNIVFYPVCKL